MKPQFRVNQSKKKNYFHEAKVTCRLEAQTVKLLYRDRTTYWLRTQTLSGFKSWLCWVIWGKI